MGFEGKAMNEVKKYKKEKWERRKHIIKRIIHIEIIIISFFIFIYIIDILELGRISELLSFEWSFYLFFIIVYLYWAMILPVFK